MYQEHTKHIYSVRLRRPLQYNHFAALHPGCDGAVIPEANHGALCGMEGIQRRVCQWIYALMHIGTFYGSHSFKRNNSWRAFKNPDTFPVGPLFNTTQ
jgi:hypothetical protein